MTATVVSLDSRRRNQEPACGCPRHLLAAMVQRVQLQVLDADLLVDRTILESVAADVAMTVDRAVEANGAAR